MNFQSSRNKLFAYFFAFFWLIFFFNVFQFQFVDLPIFDESYSLLSAYGLGSYTFGQLYIVWLRFLTYFVSDPLHLFEINHILVFTYFYFFIFIFVYQQSRKLSSAILGLILIFLSFINITHNRESIVFFLSGYLLLLIVINYLKVKWPISIQILVAIVFSIDRPEYMLMAIFQLIILFVYRDEVFSVEAKWPWRLKWAASLLICLYLFFNLRPKGTHFDQVIQKGFLESIGLKEFGSLTDLFFRYPTEFMFYYLKNCFTYFFISLKKILVPIYKMDWRLLVMFFIFLFVKIEKINFRQLLNRDFLRFFFLILPIPIMLFNLDYLPYFVLIIILSLTKIFLFQERSYFMSMSFFLFLIVSLFIRYNLTLYSIKDTSYLIAYHGTPKKDLVLKLNQEKKNLNVFLRDPDLKYYISNDKIKIFSTDIYQKIERQCNLENQLDLIVIKQQDLIEKNDYYQNCFIPYQTIFQINKSDYYITLVRP